MDNDLAVIQPAVHTVKDLATMADAFARSGMFGISRPDQALALLLIAQAEGIHPARAMMEYHVIEGKPSLKADAMLARHQHGGGKVQWITRTDECVRAKFTGPLGEVEICWDRKRAEQAGLWGKQNFRKHPAQMLAARCISEGVRAVNAAAVQGIYTPEEVECFEPGPARVAADTGEMQVIATTAEPPERGGHAEPGDPPQEFVQLAVDACEESQFKSGPRAGQKVLRMRVRKPDQSAVDCVDAIYAGEQIKAGFIGEILCTYKYGSRGGYTITHIEAVMHSIPPLDPGAQYPDEAEGMEQ